MPANEGQYFYGAGSGTVGWRDASNVEKERVGKTRDGIEIFRFQYNYARNGRQKVYLALKMDGKYHLVFGSGYDQLTTGKRDAWSGGRIYDSSDIQARYSNQLDLR